MGLFRRSQPLALPTPTQLAMLDGEPTRRRPDELRNLVLKARSEAGDTESPEGGDVIAQSLAEVVVNVESQLSEDEQTSPAPTYASLQSEFDLCMRLGVAAARIEERDLRAKAGRSSSLGHEFLALVAIRETKGVPEPYRILGHYLTRVAHYVTRQPATFLPDIVLSDFKKTTNAIANNQKYLELVAAVDEIWDRCVGD